MNEDTSAPVSPQPEQPKRNNTWIIILVVVLVICCVCAGIITLGWQFGDQLLKTLGIT